MSELLHQCRQSSFHLLTSRTVVLERRLHLCLIPAHSTAVVIVVAGTGSTTTSTRRDPQFVLVVAVAVPIEFVPVRSNGSCE